jgi:hypothetical protein
VHGEVSYGIVPVELDDGTCPYLSWLRRQTTTVQVVADAMIRELLAYEGPNLARTEFGKALGSGLFELRARQTARTLFHRFNKPIPATLQNPDQEILIRIFYAMEGGTAVLLLGGLDKGKSNSKRNQDRQIEAARKTLARYRREQIVRRKRRRRST